MAKQPRKTRSPTTVTLSQEEFGELMGKARISGRGLLVHAKWLRKCAAEIQAEGHAGWGNTCLQAAEAIEHALGKHE